MTESGIFQILLEKNKNEDYNYDYPKLQAQAADIAAEKFTEIIYESLKQKSTASRMKRGNILKYIYKTCGVKECHLNEDSFECFFKILKKSLRSDEAENVTELVKQISSELETEVPNNLTDTLIDFYQRKNARQKEKIKKLEFINENIEEKLSTKFDMQVKKNISYYEISDNMIRTLIGSAGSELSEINLSTSLTHTTEYREKQIKFCYALLNLKNDKLYFLEEILQRISRYKELKKFEMNFLIYLWFFEEERFNFSSIISEKFPFILERFILKYATEIAQLKEDDDVHEYFTNLQNDKKLKKIRQICTENLVLNKTMQSMIYELYCHSYCNKNVLKLINFIK